MNKNLINAEFYRLFHTKSARVIFILAIVSAIFTGSSMGLVFGNAEFLPAYYLKLNQTLQMSGYAVTDFSSNPFKTIFGIEGLTISTYSDFLLMALYGYLPTLYVIFVFVFCTSVRRTGMFRYYYGNFSYFRIFFTQALVLLCYTFAISLVTIGFYALTGLIFFKGYEFGRVLELILQLLMTILLLFNCGLYGIILTEAVKKRGIGALIFVLYFLFVNETVYSLFDAMLSRTGFMIEYVVPYGCMNILTPDNMNTYYSAILVFVVHLLIQFLLAYRISKRKDTCI